MDKQELIGVWDVFSKKNGSFKLNPDRKHVEIVADGVLSNEQKHGLKLCPCRLRDGTFEKDMELICPCNFFIHETWLRPRPGMQPMCWCGLFVKA
ncbi:ferredoxin:thioredoxin reductase [Candidatus Woesearchaeota archaeon]|nr:ferredoxin:thioredoxin reductase [Candidatus Woesearchaeota archaeon]